MSAKESFVRNLAAAFLAGPWTLKGLVDQGTLACGRREPWLRSLARRVLALWAGGQAGIDEKTLSRFILSDNGFDKAWMRHGAGLTVRQVFWVPLAMTPRPGQAASWSVPALATPAALADWLGLRLPELDWFADCRGREAKAAPGPLRHYTYHWLTKRSGKARLLEMPKLRLKTIQRRLLHEILGTIPAHEAVHGYRRGRSVATYAAPHVAQEMVLRFDLRAFFPSIRSSRVHALFRTAGYPAPVARLLTGLCTNVVPPEVYSAAPEKGKTQADWQDERYYRSPHLPQGAPTSPALANLCAYRFDCRLAGLARAVGASYTRYADDLAFSGSDTLERCARRFQVHVCRIALEEGFEIQTRKTRFMRQGVRQQLAGVVLNKRLNIPRAAYENLKAILHNCIRHGPHSQNRDGRADFRSYLLGHIAYVAMLNPARGSRLRGLFQRIEWDGPERL